MVSSLRKWRLTRSTEAISELKSLASKVTDVYWRGEILSAIGDMYEFRKDWVSAREKYLEAVDCSASGLGQFYLLLSIAETHCNEGDARSAFPWFMKAIRVAKKAPGVCIAPAVLSMRRNRIDQHLSSKTLSELEDSLRLNWSMFLSEEVFPEGDVGVCAERLMHAQKNAGDMSGHDESFGGEKNGGTDKKR